MKILVTGGFGWTAQAIVETLNSDGHILHSLDLTSGVPNTDVGRIFSKIHTGDISNYQLVELAMQDIDAVVHLAIAIGDGDYDTPKVPFDTNVRGFTNILEVARHMNKSPRIILTSSAPVHLAISGVLSAIASPPLSPDGDFMYDLTKALQEDTAKYYCSVFDMDVITLRAGHIVNGRAGTDMRGRDLKDVTYNRGGWVCRYDLARAVLKALNHPISGYDAFHIIGASAARKDFDIEYTERVLEHFNEVDFAAYA